MNSQNEKTSEPTAETYETFKMPWEHTFRINLIYVRELRGISQTGLAKLLKAEGLPFHQQTVQRIEDGKRPIRLNEAFVMARVLGVDIFQLLSGAGAQGLERDVELNAADVARGMVKLFSDWDDHLGPIRDNLLDVLIDAREPVTEAIASPDVDMEDRTVWLWAVAIRLVDVAERILDAYDSVSAFEHQSVPRDKWTEDSHIRRLEMWLSQWNQDKDLQQFLTDLLREDHACLEGVSDDRNPFRLARSGAMFDDLLAWGRR
ncbi:helix-turn-helix transcriptional regulator [Nesterenkonia sp. CF4.4]|uniref:helix-turn-helix transcriptional regulator n=1 Tax=Nesterenkonia sp. CF4.4 TaxID=3373079 RepID=UPI003EE7895F